MKGNVHRRLSVTPVASYLQSASLAEKQAWFAGVESPGGRAANTSLALPPLTHYLTDSGPRTWGAARWICLNLRVSGCLRCSLFKIIGGWKRSSTSCTSPETGEEVTDSYTTAWQTAHGHKVSWSLIEAADLTDKAHHYSLQILHRSTLSEQIGA